MSQLLDFFRRLRDQGRGKPTPLPKTKPPDPQPVAPDFSNEPPLPGISVATDDQGRIGPGTFGTPPEDEKRELFGAEMVDEFVRGDLLLQVESSNVSWMNYFPKENKLRIGYHGGRKDGSIAVYDYWGVTPIEAKVFAQAASKGKASWDFLRVRGSKIMHQKPYQRVK